MTTDTNSRDLIQRLTKNLDHLNRLYNVPDQSALVEESLDFLSQPEPEGSTDEQIEKSFQLWWFNEGSGMRPSNGEDQEEHVRRVSQIAWSNGAYVARWGRPAVKPVPVSERPWEREGWCDNNGWCWGFDADGTDECWSFDRPEAWVCWTHVLPHYALPIPTTTQEEN